MNAVQTTDKNITAAAVVFMKADDKRELVMGAREGEAPKPYFYLNIVEAKEGDLCLVGSTGWNLVKVMRIIPLFADDGSAMNSNVLGKITQPLLCRVTEYDAEKVREAGRKLMEFQFRTSEMRVQKEIDRALLDDIDLEIERVRTKRPFIGRHQDYGRDRSTGSVDAELGDDWRNGKD